jgi:hypothetical protein
LPRDQEPIGCLRAARSRQPRPARWRGRLTLLLVLLGAPGAAAQPLGEYEVKAAFLFNFLKYIQWPPAPAGSPLNICVAGRNPFGDALVRTVEGERIDGRPVRARVILEPEAGCHLLFIPDGANSSAYLRAARNTPTLTVGESPGFLARGGVINFVLDGTTVRFEIDAEAARRTGLEVSSRLLRLGVAPAGGRG